MQIFVEYLHMKRKQKHTTKIQCNFIERIIVSREARKLTNKRKPKKKKKNYMHNPYCANDKAATTKSRVRCDSRAISIDLMDRMCVNHYEFALYTIRFWACKSAKECEKKHT